MDTESFEVEILVDGGRKSAVLTWYAESGNSDAEVLRLELSGEVLEGASEQGVFEAMCELRRNLEAVGVLLVCYGGSEKVYPSPMSLSMGGGQRSYRLTLGQQARTECLVSIFDTGADVIPATVERQADFYQRWLKSLRKA